MGVVNARFRSCMKSNANEENLLEVMAHNLEVLNRIVDYNIQNKIQLFRITSDLIPFGSSPVNTVKWWDIFEERFQQIGSKLSENNIRVSMHPGQYTVLNSPNQEVVKRAIEDLKYHNQVLDALGMETEHKLVLHIGGVYGHKEEAIERFGDSYENLDTKIKRRLVIENDDKLYNIADVLSISERTKVPVVFDVLHHNINPPEENNFDICEWIERCRKTWKLVDGTQKIHYSEQHPNKRRGSHSDTVTAAKFMEFFKRLDREDIDIMLEVKDKNLSAIKCRNLTAKQTTITLLEQEWSRYKYLILGKSSDSYNLLRQQLKNKQAYPVEIFYHILEDAMLMEENKGSAINAAQHVWGYFKKIAAKEEKQTFERKIQNYLEDKITENTMKKYLWKLTLKYQENYLYHSYYFLDVMN
jgi:UV damage endonuclease UvdE